MSVPLRQDRKGAANTPAALKSIRAARPDGAPISRRSPYRQGSRKHTSLRRYLDERFPNTEGFALEVAEQSPKGLGAKLVTESLPDQVHRNLNEGPVRRDRQTVICQRLTLHQDCAPVAVRDANLRNINMIATKARVSARLRSKHRA